MAIVGPTAAGKSAVAIQVARRVGATILSVDSMQVYRGLDIGTAKPTMAERHDVAHLMIDVVEPNVDFTVAQFQQMARRHLQSAAKPVLMAGGSGLHLRAVVDPLVFPPSDSDLRLSLESVPDDELVAELLSADKGAGGAVELSNRRRVVRAVEILRLTGLTPTARALDPEAQDVKKYRSLYPVTLLGLDPGRSLADRVEVRVNEMRERGLLDEVRQLAGNMGRLASQAVGYKELTRVVEGRLSEDAGFEEMRRATLALMKRQRTFFRRDPRIRWIPPESDDVADIVTSAVEGATQ